MQPHLTGFKLFDKFLGFVVPFFKTMANSQDYGIYPLGYFVVRETISSLRAVPSLLLAWRLAAALTKVFHRCSICCSRLRPLLFFCL